MLSVLFFNLIKDRIIRLLYHAGHVRLQACQNLAKYILCSHPVRLRAVYHPVFPVTSPEKVCIARRLPVSLKWQLILMASKHTEQVSYMSNISVENTKINFVQYFGFAKLKKKRKINWNQEPIMP